MNKLKKLVLGGAAIGVLLMLLTLLSAGPAFAKALGTWGFNTFVVHGPSTQVIGAGDTVAADACGAVKKISATAARTTSTTNTFSAPSLANADCILHVYNDSAFAITLDNNANFMSAGAADVVLGSSDTVIVGSNGTVWFQIGGTGNN